jgi:NADP-dependent 3-hydroxy acid dehydrogenase YdfG
VIADIRDGVAMMALVHETIRDLGGLDTLVTCAGIQRYGAVTDVDEATWNEVSPGSVDTPRGAPRPGQGGRPSPPMWPRLSPS